MARIIRHYKVYMRHLSGGSEFLAGLTNDNTLAITDGFLLLEHPEHRNRIGINAAEIGMYRLDPEYQDNAAKNT